VKLIMVAIHDSKSELFGRPLFVRAFGEAERSFADVVNDGKSDYAKYPADFTLFEIGSFDDVTGVLTALAAPRSLGAAVTFVKNGSLLRSEA
jgi:hypothetical protein